MGCLHVKHMYQPLAYRCQHITQYKAACAVCSHARSADIALYLAFPTSLPPPPHRMHTLNNIETANLVWVFAKWGVTPSPTWLAAFSAQLQSQLLSLQPPELCSVLWAAAMMQLQLPNPVMDVLLLEAQVGRRVQLFVWCAE